jgi:hypothetical protein
MPPERPRGIEIDGADQPVLNARSIVLNGGACEDIAAPAPEPRRAGPAVVWEGSIQGDGTGPQRSYYVRLYADRTAHCQCPSFYFRGVLRRDAAFACKHVLRARVAAGNVA